MSSVLQFTNVKEREFVETPDILNSDIEKFVKDLKDDEFKLTVTRVCRLKSDSTDSEFRVLRLKTKVTTKETEDGCLLVTVDDLEIPLNFTLESSIHSSDLDILAAENNLEVSAILNHAYLINPNTKKVYCKSRNCSSLYVTADRDVDIKAYLPAVSDALKSSNCHYIITMYPNASKLNPIAVTFTVAKDNKKE